MWLYTGFLRVIIHVLAIGILVGSTLAGMGMVEAGPLTGLGRVFGGIAGFICGAVVAGVLVGTIALLFEIRDALQELRASSIPATLVTAGPGDKTLMPTGPGGKTSASRREPSL